MRTEVSPSFLWKWSKVLFHNSIQRNSPLHTHNKL